MGVQETLLARRFLILVDASPKAISLEPGSRPDNKMQQKYFFKTARRIYNLHGHANPKLVFGMEIKEACTGIELDQDFTKI